jgi:PilZ domain
MTARPRDRRRDRRIDVALPVILENATGVTRDVSASGVFFWTDGMYLLGDSITFSMGRRGETGKFMLKCRGVVFRTEPRGNEVGIAVRVTQPVTKPA